MSRIMFLCPLTILLFAAMILVTLICAQPPPVTVVSVLPSIARVTPGQKVSVDVNITDVTDLWGYEIRIWYLNSVVNATAAEVVRPTGNFMEPMLEPIPDFPDGNYWVPKWEVINNYNATHGRIWVAYTLVYPEAPRTGSGILFRITFTGVALGSTPIVLSDDRGGRLGPILLANFDSLPIPHIGKDGSIEVVTSVALLGDVNQDGIVDVLDLVRIAMAYGSDPTMPNWNQACDLNGDNAVDILDLTLVASNFGQIV